MKFKKVIKNKKFLVGCLIVLLMFGAPAGKIIADKYSQKAIDEYNHNFSRTCSLDRYCDLFEVEFEYDEECHCRIYDLNAEITGWS